MPGAGDAAAGGGSFATRTSTDTDEAEQGESEILRNNSSNTRRVVNNVSFYVSKEGNLSSFRLRAIDVLCAPYFETLIGLVIAANSVTIGVELSMRLEAKDTGSENRAIGIIEALEHFFLVVYTLELGLRFFAMGLGCLKDISVVFDCVLVLSGVLMTWILSPLGLDSLGETGGLVGVLRTLRLLRLARTVRLIVKFRELWMLVRSLMNSASTMCYTCLLLIIVLYILACVGVELVGLHEMAYDPDSDFSKISQMHFRTVGITMITLVQFVTLDSVGVIYRPLIEADPLIMAAYFMGVILVVGIVLMNLITAVVVNSALEQASQDKDAAQMHERKAKERLIRDLRRMFERLDQDRSGQITREEILAVNDRDRALFYNAVELSNPMEIFDALDVDDSGSIDIDEFCDGIWQVALANTPIELKKISKQVMVMRETMGQFLSSQAKLDNKLGLLMKATAQARQSGSGSGYMVSTASMAAASSVASVGLAASTVPSGVTPPITSALSPAAHADPSLWAPPPLADQGSAAPPWVESVTRDLQASVQAAMLELLAAGTADLAENRAFFPSMKEPPQPRGTAGGRPAEVVDVVRARPRGSPERKTGEGADTLVEVDEAFQSWPLESAVLPGVDCSMCSSARGASICAPSGGGMVVEQEGICTRELP